MLYQLGCTLHMIRLSRLNTLLLHNVLTLLRERWHIYYFLELKGWRGVVSVPGSSLHSWERERFSIAYRGTKTKLTATANISKWYFQKEAARFLSKKKAWGSNSAKVTISFHFASDWLQGWRKFLDQSQSKIQQHQNNTGLHYRYSFESYSTSSKL